MAKAPGSIYLFPRLSTIRGNLSENQQGYQSGAVFGLPQPGQPQGLKPSLLMLHCHFLLQCIKVKSESEVTQSFLTLSDPMDCSLPAPLSSRRHI